MKRTELKKDLSDFENSLVFDKFRDDYYPEKSKIIYNHIKNATDTKDFIERILADEKLIGEQVQYRLLESRRPGQVWMTIRKTLGDRVFKTWSEGGAVRIGVNGCHFNVGNGRGDGETRIAVLPGEDDAAEWVTRLMTFSGSFDGENIDICKTDYSDAPATTISGRYGIWTYDGIVVFEKWH